MTYIPKFPMERDKVVSDKEKVLAKWPDADHQLNLLADDPSKYHYITGAGELLGNGYTEPEAWADAARRLEDGK